MEFQYNSYLFKLKTQCLKFENNTLMKNSIDMY